MADFVLYPIRLSPGNDTLDDNDFATN